PPRSMPPTLPKPRLEPAALLLELALRLSGERRERLDDDSASLGAPDAGDVAVDRERRLHVGVLAHDDLEVLPREDPLAVDQHVVELRQEADGRVRVRRRNRCPWKVEKRSPAAVPHRAQPVQQVREPARVEAGPARDLGAGRRPERRQQAPPPPRPRPPRVAPLPPPRRRT